MKKFQVLKMMKKPILSEKNLTLHNKIWNKDKTGIKIGIYYFYLLVQL